jgi:vitamin B12/bleomycin/antimicrobial peptide transport system ATP-binding/permease protein
LQERASSRAKPRPVRPASDDRRSPVKGFFSTLAIIWRLAVPYFNSEDWRAGRLLLGAVVTIELAIVAINVALNWWNARFYNAIQEHDWGSFVNELLFFCMLAGAYVVLAVYQLYLNQWLQIRWRRFMTGRYLEQWLDGPNHYRMQLLGDAADNPDQRVAEDVQLFVEKALSLGLGLLNSVVSLGSFTIILWGLSASAPLTLFGLDWSIPGYLVWAALLYATIGTVFTHLIGRRLIPLNFNQQRYEADFRFNLVRVRENSEQIALLDGEPAERVRLMDRFTALANNWLALMTQTKRLTFFTASYNQIAVVLPFIMVSPAYFAGRVQLGALTQTAEAFGQVQSSLSFFVTAYRQLAEWRSVIARLDGFEAAIAAATRAAHTPPVVAVVPESGATAVRLDDVAINLPTGAPLVGANGVVLPAGDHVLVTGPTGAGKSTLFRAIGGIWPFGSGRVVVPDNARMTMLPQRPYFPVGSLEAAVSYPAVPGAFERGRVAEALTAVGLPGYVRRLDEHGHWNRTLSLGEQERLAIARALLLEPDYLFLDEATASLDEASEHTLYRLLQARLPRAAIISIGHRSTLFGLHRRRLVLASESGRMMVRERREAEAAS